MAHTFLFFFTTKKCRHLEQSRDSVKTQETTTLPWLNIYAINQVRGLAKII